MAYSFASSLWDTSTGLLARQLDLSSPAAAAAVGEAQQQQSQQQVDSQDDLQQAYAKVVTRLHFYIIACFAVLVWDILVSFGLPFIHSSSFKEHFDSNSDYPSYTCSCSRSQ